MKKAAIWVTILSLFLWLAIPSVKQAMKIHDGKRCRENLVYLQHGKNAYIQSRTTMVDGKPVYPANPNKYMDLIPYMPLKNIPECPSGKPYLNTLDLQRACVCQVNGQADYEADTPGTNPKKNGFHDGAVEAQYLGWWQVPLKMLHLYKEKSPFQKSDSRPTETQ